MHHRPAACPANRLSLKTSFPRPSQPSGQHQQGGQQRHTEQSHRHRGGNRTVEPFPVFGQTPQNRQHHHTDSKHSHCRLDPSTPSALADRETHVEYERNQYDHAYGIRRRKRGVVSQHVASVPTMIKGYNGNGHCCEGHRQSHRKEQDRPQKGKRPKHDQCIQRECYSVKTRFQSYNKENAGKNRQHKPPCARP